MVNQNVVGSLKNQHHNGINPTTEDTNMEEKELDYVSQKIIEVLREKFPNDKGYVQDKINRLALMENKFEAFSWALNQLDSDNLFSLFEKLGLDLKGHSFYNHLFKCL